MWAVRASCQTRIIDGALQEFLGQLLPEAAVIKPPSPPPTIWADITSSNGTPPFFPLSNMTVPFLGLFPWLPLLVHKRSPQLQSFLHSCLGSGLLTNPPPNFFTVEILLTPCPKQNKLKPWLLSLQPHFHLFHLSAFFIHLSSKLSMSKCCQFTNSE